MTPALRRKLEEFLSLDSPANYDCWEDAEESILEDLTEAEAEEYTQAGDPIIEEWFAANEETEKKMIKH